MFFIVTAVKVAEDLISFTDLLVLINLAIGMTEHETFLEKVLSYTLKQHLFSNFIPICI